MNLEHLYTKCRSIALVLGGMLLFSFVHVQACNLSASFSSAPVCTPYTLSFSDQSVSNAPVLSWVWLFGDGTTQSGSPIPSHTYASAGNYTVKLLVVDQAGCLDSMVQVINVPEIPTLAVLADSFVCLGNQIDFVNQTVSNGAQISSWLWSAGDGTTYNTQHFSHTYQLPGWYNVVLTATYGNGCQLSLSTPLNVRSLPEPKPAFSIQCATNIVHFSDTANYSVPVSSCLWDFGDNSSSTALSPSHYYPNNGTYDVQLSVTDVKGCIGTATEQLTLGEPLSVSFQSFSVCKGDTVSLNAQLLSGTVPVSDWQWDFGDGTSCSGQTVSHLYALPGTYMVSVIATDTNGCTGQASHPGVVRAAPQAQFSANPAFFGSPSELISQIQVGSAPVTYRRWEFGDGTPPVIVTQDTVHHVYPSPGQFDATLYIADSLGCQDTATGLLEVWSNYVKAEWVADTVCSGRLTRFFDQSMVGSGDIVSWLWNFGDNAVSYEQNPVHSYDSAGTYQVVLVITTDLGITDSAKANVLVYDSPIAAFDYTATCEMDEKVFYNLSTIPAGSGIVAFQWNLGDGSTSALFQPKRTYNLPGDYPVSLVVTSDRGCTDTAEYTLQVGAKPEVNFGSDKNMGCGQAVVTFTDSVNLSSGSIQSWLWDFGDGVVSMSPQSVKHTYNDVGFYSVMLTVGTDKGCFTTKMNPSMIHVRPNPVAAFDFDPLEADIHRPTVFFQNHSEGGFKYYWNFGDGNSTTVYEPAHNYVREGEYQITLKVETEYGCVDYEYRNIKVKSEPVFYVPNAFTPNGDGTNDYFKPVGTAFTDEGAVTWEFQIYDRAGNLIYDSPGDLRGWDGTVRDNYPAPEGVYVCRIVQQDPDGRKHSHIGQVTLLR